MINFLIVFIIILISIIVYSFLKLNWALDRIQSLNITIEAYQRDFVSRFKDRNEVKK